MRITIRNFFINLGLLLLYALSSAYAFIFNQPFGWFLFFFFSLLVGTSLLSLVFPLGSIVPNLDVPSYTNVHQTVTCQLTLTSRHRWPLPLPSVQLLLPAGFSLEEKTLLNIRSGKPQSLTVVWTPSVRGQQEQLPIRLIAKDFLGLFRKSRTATVSFSTTVLPAYDKEHARLLIRQVTPMLLFQQTFGRSFEIKQYRPYQDGDSLKKIDWKLSAHNQELILREYEEEPLLKQSIGLWGSSSPTFEDTVTLAYSFFRSRSSTETPSLFLLGTASRSSNSLSDFASIQPGNPEMFSAKLKKLHDQQFILFAPEDSPLLQDAVKQLEKRNDVFLFFYRENTLYLQRHSQLTNLRN